MDSENTNSATVVRPRLGDSDAEASFDALPRLVVQSLHIPIAIVSLVQDGLELVVAHTGVDSTRSRQVISLFGRAAFRHSRIIIRDVARDARFESGPPYMRPRMGIALVALEGRAVGTPCVVDCEPRQFTDRERAELCHFGLVAQHMIGSITLHANRKAGLDTATHRVENLDISWIRRPSDLLMLVP